MRKLLVAMLIAAASAVLATQALAATRSVKVSDDYFVRKGSVPTVTVKKGTKVTWRWAGKDMHNVTVTKGPVRFQSSYKSSGTFSKRRHAHRHVHDRVLDPPAGDDHEAPGHALAPIDRSPPPMAAASSTKKIRVVVAKPGLDGHDRGAKIIARALRDAGMEVIYTGLHQTPEQIVETVLQEDADAVGLSILSGAHMTLVPKVIELLREQDAGDVIVTVGGTIPAQDIAELKELGVAEVFTPGAPTQAIIDFIKGSVTL